MRYHDSSDYINKYAITANRKARTGNKNMTTLKASLFEESELSSAAAVSAVVELELLFKATPTRTFFDVSLELKPELRNGRAMRPYRQIMSCVGPQRIETKRPRLDP
jgi:hypothetical protein